MATTDDMKWEKDLRMYMDTFSSFIFEGNINDLQPVQKGERYEYLTLEEAIAKRYGKDYCVVIFDRTRKSGQSIAEPCAPEDNPDWGDDDPETQGGSAVGPEWFNSFIFDPDNASSNSVNVEYFSGYYRTEYMDRISAESTNDMQSGAAMDMRRMVDAINDFGLTRDAFPGIKPFMFILPDLSRYMTNPGDPNDYETVLLMLLFKAMMVNDSGCKLMMFVDKLNDLPTWFESENTNSAVKKIFIPLPDSPFRGTFCLNEMKDMNPKYGEAGYDDKKELFVSFTENFSVRRLQQLRTFIKRESEKEGNGYMTDLGSIDKTVMIFNTGYSTNPWKRPELKKSIREIEDVIGKEIIGQEDVIKGVKRTLRAAVAGINTSKKNDRRPKAVFFFAGPTGTGKTQMAKEIAKQIFHREDSMIRFDMSEFGQGHTDSRLFGAPPGYVGYEAGGELTRAIKQNPFSIVLFDEIEKASSSIWDKFLQILGDGRLTDGKGETVSFTESIIVFTSNLGMTSPFDQNDDKTIDMQRNKAKEVRETIANIESSQGEDRSAAVKKLYELEKNNADLYGLKCSFKNRALFQDYSDSYNCSPNILFNRFVSEYVKDRIDQYFRAIGRPEIKGRIGESNVLVFNFMDEYSAEQIAEKELEKYCKALRYENDNHLQLDISEEAKKYIISTVQKPEVLEYGGRGVVETVDKLLSAPLSDFLFDHDDVSNGAVLEYVSGELKVSPK